MSDRPELSPPFSDDDADDIGDLATIVGFNLRLAQGAVQRQFAETFADLGLTQKQVSVLWLVRDRPGLSQAGLSARMRMDKATTLAIVNRLQARGLIERRASRQDRRVQGLHLTPAGLDMLATAKDAIAHHEQWLKSRFTAKEVETLINLLVRIRER